MKIEVIKLKDNAILPTRGSASAAGYDLYACLDSPVTINSLENIKIGTGLAMALPEGYFGAVFARSGLASKMGLRPANCVGVIDSDYRGEFIVPIYNDSDTERVVEHGERIAQLVVMPYLPVEFAITDSLDETKRGTDGFGSTGK